MNSVKLVRGRRRPASRESGNALVEFIAIMMVIIGPALVLLTVCASLVSAQFAIQAATRDATRQVVRSTSSQPAQFVQQVAAEIWHYRGRSEELSTQISCTTSPCLRPGSIVTVTANTTITLPVIAVDIPLSASHTMPVDSFVGRP